MENTGNHEDIIKFLEDKIYEHNSSSLSVDDGELFSRVIKNDDGKIIAGIAGWTWANVCEITQLWVDSSARNSGIGKMLLESAEAEVKQKGCKTIVIKSYEFQAPLYYKKHGYVVKCILKNFPEGFNYFILSKSLSVK